MSELGSSTDAPPPPPPPPPPDTGSKEATPDASPDLEKALRDGGQSGADGGSQDGGSIAKAQEQAADAKTRIEPYQQRPADVPDGALVTPDLTPSGPPDVSPELAEALPKEPEPVGAEELAGLQTGPGELDSGQAAEPLQADSSDPVWQRQTWDGGTEGADLPPSMKEDLQGLGNDLREIVDPAAWEKADLDGREDMLNAANDRIREEYGLPQQDVSYRSVADDPHLAGVAGSFDPDTGEIVINRSQLADSDPGEALKTLAHENFHDYQERAQVGDSSDPFGQSRAQEWREADANYPDPKDYGSRREYLIDYLNNPLERDARAVENEVYSGYKEDKR